MLYPWFSVILAFEACEVVTLRLKSGSQAPGMMPTAGLASSLLDNNPWGRERVAANASHQVTARPRLASQPEHDRILQERTGRLPPSHRQTA